ncbi:MAG: hypothetical protein J5913_06315 [Prevotella sp.]|nr:hypothetical protein [Prevotella sp.]
MYNSTASSNTSLRRTIQIKASTPTGATAAHTGQSGRRRSCSIRSSTHIISGTNVRRSSVMATMLRTSRSSVRNC